MEDVLPVLLSFPPSAPLTPQEFDKQATAYAKHVTSLPTTTWTSMKDEKKPLLEILNPHNNTIPYLVCLVAQLQKPGINNAELEALVPWLSTFLHQFDPIQARFVGAFWRTLLSLAADVYRALRVGEVYVLGDAILRIDPTAATFTSSHLVYLTLCIQAGRPGCALRILDKDIYSIPTNSPKNAIEEEVLSERHEMSNTFITHTTGLAGKITPEMVLEYYLQGAWVYIGQKNWSRARLFLEFVILHPSPHGTTSALQVEAYKKWILVGLLSQGTTFTVPRTVGQQVLKGVKAVGRPYDALAETFESRDWRKFQAEQEIGATIWHDDGNTRLVQEAGSALLRHCVASLQKTCAALPISRVAAHLGLPPDQTLTAVSDLIQRQQLRAKIESGGNDATLRFDLTPNTSKVDDVTIEARTQRIEGLLLQIKDANRRLQLTKEHIDVVRRSKKQGTETDPADQMDLEWNNPSMPISMPDDDGDEDIMA